MTFSYAAIDLEQLISKEVTMVFFSKARKAAFKREATKRKNENPWCASVVKCGRLGADLDLDSETESDGEYDDLLDILSLDWDSGSEYSFDSDGSYENRCFTFNSCETKEDENECLQSDQKSEVPRSANVWETFDASTSSDLRNLLVVSNDMDGLNLFEKWECDREIEVIEEIEEVIPDHHAANDSTVDEDQGSCYYFPCTENCCASLESLASTHDDYSAHIPNTQYAGDNDDPMEGSSKEVAYLTFGSDFIEPTMTDESIGRAVVEKLDVKELVDRSVIQMAIDNSSNNSQPILSKSKKSPFRSPGDKHIIIDTHQYSQTIESAWFTVEGRRIVDWNYVSKCLLEAQRTHSKTCPGLLCMMDEKYRSMISVMILQCDACEAKFKVRTEEPSEKPQLRRCMVWATVCSGGTFNSTKELLTLCNIPFMPISTFICDEMNLDVILEETMKISLDRAVQAEKQAVYGDQHPEPTSEDQRGPVKLSVALDGSWGTRSYGKRFNSASGCGVIIGEKSKKILFAGCRNKRCSVCNRTNRSKKEETDNSHRCYKNYTGSSGGMESDIMIEGFKKLMDDGIWLTMITTDGDSTTVAKLKNALKYGASIQHQLCCNHVTKNCGKKLREIKYPKEVADIVSKNLERIPFGIRCAIKHCAEETNGLDVEGLRLDIRNVPAHVFGNHDNCRNYFCSKQTLIDENYIPLIDKCGVLLKIQKVVDSVAAKAEFLNYNKTSNAAENVFSRLCKYNVGKRLNIMSRGSYQRRVWITVLQHNDGYDWHYEGLEKFAGCTPCSFLQKMVDDKQKLKEATVKSKSRPEYSRKPTKQTETDKDYGPQAIEAAERIQEFEKMDVDVIQMYSLTPKSKEKVMQNLTIPELEEFAKGRILSRFVADIVWSTPKTLSQKCENILITTNTWNYIKQNRMIIGPITEHLKTDHGYEMGGSRIFIDECHSFLCCIPDAVSISSDEILMVKKKAVPGLIRDYASNDKGGIGCKIKDGEIILDRKTYCEAQIALHVCNIEKALYVFVNVNDFHDYFLKEVSKDDSYFSGKVEDKIVNFVDKFLLRKVVEDDIFIKC